MFRSSSSFISQALRATSKANQSRQLSSGSFDKIGIVGLGLMGHGIAQVAAQSGVNNSIIAYEVEQKFLESGKSRIEGSLDKLVKREKITAADAETTLGRITFTTDMDALKDTEFIVEAVIEDMKLKEDLYTKLGQICQPDTIFASNTSSLSITEMSLFSGRPDKFVGVHFFNPVQIMKLVEIIKTEHTNQEVFDKAYKWGSDIGKVPVSCGDTPGKFECVEFFWWRIC